MALDRFRRALAGDGLRFSRACLRPGGVAGTLAAAGNWGAAARCLAPTRPSTSVRGITELETMDASGRWTAGAVAAAGSRSGAGCCATRWGDRPVPLRRFPTRATRALGDRPRARSRSDRRRVEGELAERRRPPQATGRGCRCGSSRLRQLVTGNRTPNRRGVVHQPPHGGDACQRIYDKLGVSSRAAAAWRYAGDRLSGVIYLRPHADTRQRRLHRRSRTSRVMLPTPIRSPVPSRLLRKLPSALAMTMLPARYAGHATAGLCLELHGREMDAAVADGLPDTGRGGRVRERIGATSSEAARNIRARPGRTRRGPARAALYSHPIIGAWHGRPPPGVAGTSRRPPSPTRPRRGRPPR